MKITPKKYAQGLAEAVLGQTNEQIDQITLQFVNLLIKKNALSLGQQIIKELTKIQDTVNNKVEVTLTTARALEPDEQKILISLLKKKLDKDIRLINLVDPLIIGGLTISFQDDFIDNSIKNHLNELRKNLTSN